MQLPSDLQFFKNPTLIVTDDFEKTILYVTNNQTIEENQIITATKPGHPNSEGSVRISQKRFANSDSGIDEGPDRLAYSKDIAAAIQQSVSAKNISDIYLVMPPELLRRVHEQLSPNTNALVTRELDKTLMKYPLIDVLKRLTKIPKSITE